MTHDQEYVSCFCGHWTLHFLWGISDVCKSHNITDDSHFFLCVTTTCISQSTFFCGIALYSMFCPIAKECPTALRFSVLSLQHTAPAIPRNFFQSSQDESVQFNFAETVRSWSSSTFSISKKMSNGAVFLVLLFHFDNLLVDLASTWEKKNRDTPRHPRSGNQETCSPGTSSYSLFCLGRFDL